MTEVPRTHTFHCIPAIYTRHNQKNWQLGV
uniref:Uncharacterized protein n=1 Tax=Arundo donax TaxID=35708 RepID=A0A0A9H1Q5_ARUDO